MTGFGPELDRARDAMRRRDADPGFAPLYDLVQVAPLQRYQSRERAFADLLRGSGLRSIAGLRILDVGCGGGRDLLRLVGFGAAPADLAGVDLSEDRIAQARSIVPGATLAVGSGHTLPFPDASFDLVTQHTVFSSVVDPRLQEAIASEMRRVLRPGGRIFWYDATRASASPDFLPVGPARLRELFPGATISTRTLTLRWRLIYRVAPRSRTLANLLERIPACCSHLAAVIRFP